MIEEKDTKKDEKKTRDIVFFGSNSFMYIYKKNIKIAKALYMVTNLIKDKERVKWSLRTEVNKMIVLSREQKDIKDSLFYLYRCITNLKSLLSLATFSGNISQMNSDLILFELNHILEVMNEIKYSDEELVLAKSFFTEDRYIDNNLFVENMLKDNVADNLGSVKANMSNIGKGLIKSKGQNLKDNISKMSFTKSNDKDKRSEDIFNFIKEKGSVTIKDISASILGCSEKTIQRELVSLLDKKIIKRDGERRWSKYSVL